MRIQILPLPPVMVGDDMEDPFALIVDQYTDDVDDETAEGWRIFKENCGAKALLVVPDTVEVVDRYTETPAQQSANPLDQSCFRLSGDEDGGVGLHCRDHFDGGRPLAYYGDTSLYPAAEVPSATTLRQLQDAAAKHLAAAHKAGQS